MQSIVLNEFRFLIHLDLRFGARPDTARTHGSNSKLTAQIDSEMMQSVTEPKSSIKNSIRLFRCFMADLELLVVDHSAGESTKIAA